jgi:hypothetical protein
MGCWPGRDIVTGTRPTDRPVRKSAEDLNNLAAFYRAKALDSRRKADQATDASLRDEWIKIANGWTTLALHTER